MESSTSGYLERLELARPNAHGRCVLRQLGRGSGTLMSPRQMTLEEDARWGT